MTKKDMVKEMAKAIKEETGLTAPLKDIHIKYHHCYSDSPFIRCEVNGHIYQWDGYTLEHIAPWNMA